MPDKLISIITVVKNDKEGLQRTSDSLGRQSHRCFQWIVIDGVSTDGTKDILSDLKADVVISESDQGIYDAMNKSIKYISGDYVVFLNAGDVFDEKKSLSIITSYLYNEASQCDVLFAGTNYIFPNNSVKYRGPKKIEDCIWRALPASHQATFIKKEILEKHPYNKKYRISSDYCQFCEFYNSKYLFSYLDFPVVRFRVGDASYKNPHLILAEGWKIQKNILKLGYFKLVLSAFLRAKSIILLSLYFKISSLGFFR